MGQGLTSRIVNAQQNFSKTRKTMREKVESSKFPMVAEPALIHPHTTSVIKMRDNGAIDIFVGNDNGIRLDPNNRSISILANSSYEKIHQERKSIGRDSVQDIGGNWTVKVKGNLTFTSEGTIHLDGKNVKITAEGREVFEPLSHE